MPGSSFGVFFEIVATFTPKNQRKGRTSDDFSGRVPGIAVWRPCPSRIHGRGLYIFLLIYHTKSSKWAVTKTLFICCIEGMKYYPAIIRIRIPINQSVFHEMSTGFGSRCSNVYVIQDGIPGRSSKDGPVDDCPRVTNQRWKMVIVKINRRIQGKSYGINSTFQGPSRIWRLVEKKY